MAQILVKHVFYDALFGFVFSELENFEIFIRKYRLGRKWRAEIRHEYALLVQT
jgi:hypothetical protein